MIKINTSNLMRHLYALLLVLLTCTATAKAQVIGKNITVTVQPDHKDWNYKVGETARFTVNVLRSGTLVDNVKVDYEAGAEKYPDIKKQGVTLKDGTMQWSGKMSKPGFYRLKVRAYVNGKEYTGLCTAAFSPEQLKPYCQEPKSFDDFWKRALDEARKNDLDPTMRLLADRSTKDVNVYEVSYVNNRWNSRIYGILSVPKAPGKYPALLRVPGAGVRPYQGDTYTAPGKCIVLEIGIHGIPVTMANGVYDDLRNAALDNYWDTNLTDPEHNFYRRVVTGAVRGVDYIASLPEWDGKTIGVTGASQGGFLSLAVGALDRRITFLGVVHDAMCDFEAEAHGVAGGWPHYFLHGKADADRIEGARYYDGVNFAKRCAAPAWFSFGYNDEVVPPTSSYALYNIYPAEKTLSIYPMTAHFWYQEQWDEWQAYIINRLTK